MIITRRDRAALALALGNIRRGASELGRGPIWSYADVLDMAMESLRLGDEACDELELEIAHVVQWPWHRRMLRARAALYLRALLRADRGDNGRATYGWHCTTCDQKQTMPERCPWEGRGPGSCQCEPEEGWCGCPPPRNVKWKHHRRIRPLWEDAPPHKAKK